MAVTAEELQLLVTSDGIGETSAALDGLEAAARSARAAVGAMGAALAAVSAGGLAVAASAAADFEQELTEIEKVTTPETAAELDTELRKLASTIPLTTSELATVAEQAGRFGIEGTEAILGFTESVAKMATATDLNANQAGEAFAKLATLTQTPISQVQNLGAAINKLSNNMATSSSEIVDSMLRASGTLTQMGASTSEIVALSASLNEASESSERAGTRLRRLGQELMSLGDVRSREVGNLSTAIGVSAERFVELRDNAPVELIRRMAAAMNEGGEQAALLNSSLTTVSRQALAGLSLNLEGLDTALQSSSDQMENAGSLQEEFAAAIDTTHAQLQLLQNRLRGVAIATGQALLPALNSVISTLNSAVGWFQELNRESDGLAGVIAGVSGVIGGLTVAIAGLGPVIASMVPSLTSMVAAMAAIGGPATAATAAIVGLGLAVDRNIGGIGDAFSQVGAVVSGEFLATIQTAGSELDLMASQLAEAFGLTRDNAVSALSAIAGFLTGTFVPVVKSMGRATRSLLRAIGTEWQLYGDSIESAIMRSRWYVEDVVSGALSSLVSRTSAALGTAMDVWESFDITVKDVFLAIIGAGSDVFSFLQTFHAVTTSTLSAAESAWTRYGTTVTSAVGDSLSDAVAVTRSGVGALRSATQSALTTVSSAWQAHGDATIAALRGVAQTIDNRLVFPVRNAQRIIPPILSDIAGAFSGLLTPVQSAASGIEVSFQSVISFLRGPVIAAINTLASQTNQALFALDNAWRAHGDTVTGAIRVVVQALTTGLPAALSRIQSATQSALTRVEQSWERYGVSVEQASGAVSVVVTQAQSGLSTLQSTTSGALATAESAWDSYGVSIGQVSGAVSGVVTQAQSGLSTLQSATSSALATAESAWDAYGVSVSQASGAVSAVVTQAQSGLNTLQSATVTAVSTAEGAWNRYGRSVTQASGAVATVVSQAQSGLSTLRSATVSAVSAADSAWTTYGISVNQASGAVSAVVTQTQSGLATLQSVTRSLLGQIRSEWASHEGDVRSSVTAAMNTAQAQTVSGLNTLRSVTAARLGQVGTAWATHESDVRSAVSAAMATAQTETVSGLNALRSVTATRLGQVTTAWETHESDVRSASRGAMAAAQTVVTSGIQTVRSTTATLLPQATAVWQQHESDVRAAVDGAMAYVGTTAANALSQLRALTARLTTQISAVWSRWGDDVTAAVRSAMNFVRDHPLTVLAGLAASLTGPLGTLVALVANHWSRIESLTATHFGALESTARGAFQTIIDNVNPVTASIAGLTVIGTVVSGVLPSLTSLTGAVTTLTGGLTSLVSSFVGGGGLVSALGTVGTALAGLSAPMTAVIAGVGALAAAVVTDTGNMRTGFLDVANALGTELVATARTASSVLGPILSDLAAAFGVTEENAVGALRRISNWMSNTLVPAIQSGGQTIRGMLLQLGTWWGNHGTRVTSVVSDIVGRVSAIVSEMGAWEVALTALTPVIGSVLSRVTTLRGAGGTLRTVLQGLVGAGKLLLAPLQRISALGGAVGGRFATLITRAGGLTTTLAGKAGLTGIFSTLATRVAGFVARLTGGAGLIGLLRTIDHAAGGVVMSLGGGSGGGGLAGALAAARARVGGFIGRLVGGSGLRGILNSIATRIGALVAGLTGGGGLRGALSNVASRVGGLIASLGQSGLAGVVAAAQAAFTALRTNAMNLLTTAATTLRGKVLNLRGAWSTLTSFLRSGVVSALTRVLTLVGRFAGPLGVLIGTLATLHAAWKRNLWGIRDITNRVFSAIKSALNGDTSELRSLVSDFLATLQTIWTRDLRPLVVRARAIFEDIKTAVTAAMRWLHENAVKPALRGLRALWSRHGNMLLAELQETYTALRGYVRTLWNWLKPYVNSATSDMTSFWDRHGEKIKTILKFAFDTIGSIVGGAIDGLLTTLGILMDFIQGDFSGAISKLQGLFRRVFGGIWNWLKQWVGGFINWIDTNFLGGIIDKFLAFVNEIIGNSIIPEMFRAIASYVRGTGQTIVTNAFDTVISTITTAFQEFRTWLAEGGSWVSRLFAALGDYITSTGDSLISNAFDTVVLSIKGILRRMFNWAIGDGGSFFSSLFSDISNYIKNGGASLIEEGIDAVVLAIKSTLRRMYSWAIGDSFFPELFADIASYVRRDGVRLLGGAFGEVGNRIAQSFGNGVSNIVDNIESVLGNVLDAVEDTVDTVEDLGDINLGIDIPEPDDLVPEPPDWWPGGGGDSGGGGGGGDDSGDDHGDDDYGGRSTGGGSGGTPQLAKGGIVTDATQAIVGEGRYNEAVVPLSGSGSGPLGAAVESAMRGIVSDETMDPDDVGGGVAVDTIDITIEGDASRSDVRRGTRDGIAEVADEFASLGGTSGR